MSFHEKMPKQDTTHALSKDKLKGKSMYSHEKKEFSAYPGFADFMKKKRAELKGSNKTKALEKAK
jgi:hypothetical protein